MGLNVISELCDQSLLLALFLGLHICFNICHLSRSISLYIMPFRGPYGLYGTMTIARAIRRPRQSFYLPVAQQKFVNFQDNIIHYDEKITPPVDRPEMKTRFETRRRQQLYPVSHVCSAPCVDPTRFELSNVLRARSQHAVAR